MSNQEKLNNSKPEVENTPRRRNLFLLVLFLAFLATMWFLFFKKKEERLPEEDVVPKKEKETEVVDTSSDNPIQIILPPPAENKVKPSKEKKTPPSVVADNGSNVNAEKTTPPPLVDSENKVPDQEDKIINLPPEIAQSIFDKKINNLAQIRKERGVAEARKAINELLAAMASNVDVRYISGSTSNTIPLPQSIKTFLYEAAILYDPGMLKVEDFRHDPSTGKIVGFTIIDNYKKK